MRNDPNLECLVSCSQTLLRARGEWCDNPSLSRDVRAVVADVWQMMRIGDDTIIAEAIDELMRRGATVLPRGKPVGKCTDAELGMLANSDDERAEAALDELSERANHREQFPIEDTPCLDPPWWITER